MVGELSFKSFESQIHMGCDIWWDESRRSRASENGKYQILFPLLFWTETRCVSFLVTDDDILASVAFLLSRIVGFLLFPVFGPLNGFVPSHR